VLKNLALSGFPFTLITVNYPLIFVNYAGNEGRGRPRPRCRDSGNDTVKPLGNESGRTIPLDILFSL